MSLTRGYHLAYADIKIFSLDREHGPPNLQNKTVEGHDHTNTATFSGGVSGGKPQATAAFSVANATHKTVERQEIKVR